VAAQTSVSCQSQRYLPVSTDVTDYLIYGQHSVQPAESVVSPAAATSMTSGARLPETALVEPGTRRCPWLVTAHHGQRIKFSIVVIVEIDLTGGTQLGDDAVILPSSMSCHEKLVVHDSPLVNGEPAGDAPIVKLPICSGRLRERLIYLSVSHVVSVYVEHDSEEARSQQLAPPSGRDPSNNYIGLPLTRFILNYESNQRFHFITLLYSELYCVFVIYVFNCVS